MTTPASRTPVPPDGQAVPPSRRAFPKWLIALGIVLLLTVLWKCGSALYEGRGLANAFVQDFHQKLNNGQFEEIYNAADQGFMSAGKQEDLVKVFEVVHTKLGNASGQTLTNLQINSSAKGTFLTGQYNTTFDRGAAVETFVWVKSGSILRLYNYKVQSKALAVN